MTVNELIEWLMDMPQDAEVHYTYNYGDYNRTVVAPNVTDVQERHVRWSGYHNMPRLIDEDDDEEREAAQGGPMVVIIS